MALQHEIRSELSFRSTRRLCFTFLLVYYFPTSFRILFIRSMACPYLFFSAWLWPALPFIQILATSTLYLLTLLLSLPLVHDRQSCRNVPGIAFGFLDVPILLWLLARGEYKI